MGNKDSIYKKILNNYLGEKVETYESDRKNDKWKFEQKFVENFIKNHDDIESIIDAPIGTNRFNEIINESNNILNFIGLDLSTDMLSKSESKKNKKLKLLKYDLINQRCTLSADLVLIIRMLNLFSTEISIKIIDNLLPSAKKYCIATLRHDRTYSYIENKIHIHPIEKILKVILDHNFEYSIFDYKDNRQGNFSILLMTKKK